MPLITADRPDQRLTLTAARSQESKLEPQLGTEASVHTDPMTHKPAVTKSSLNPNIATKSERANAKHEGADERKSL